jgi:hypothetical protein
MTGVGRSVRIPREIPILLLTLRILETGREAEIRLVGNLGEVPG